MIPVFGEREKQQLISVFRAYVEEFGIDNVTVTIPCQWKELDIKPFPRLDVRFADDDAVTISVKKNGPQFCLRPEANA